MKKKNNKRLSKKQTAEIDRELTEWCKAGWEVAGNKINVGKTVQFMQAIGVLADITWRHSVNSGLAPDEDVSPMEGFMLIAYLIKELGERAGVKSLSAKGLIEKHGSTGVDAVKEMYDGLVSELNKIVPGYFDDYCNIS